MRRKIPASVLAEVSEVVALAETHTTLESLFIRVGAPAEDPPQGNKTYRSSQWLHRINDDETLDPLEILGRIVEGYMEADCDPDHRFGDVNRARRDPIAKSLARAKLQYVEGGHITTSMGSPSRSLEDLLRARDMAAIDEEFGRALRSVDTSPRDAASAAGNILESLCKIYIDEEHLDMPAKQDLPHVWDAVRKDLGFDPGRVEHNDLREILSGLLATVSGIGKLRTHGSSAHGAGKQTYRLEPRHARLTVHAAHTIVAFVIESWDKKRKDRG